MESDAVTQKQNDIQKKPFQQKCKLLIVILSLAVIAVSLVNLFRAEPDRIKYQKFSDTVIRKAVAEIASKNPDDMTDEDYAKITELVISCEILSDIRLLKKFTNLQKLQLTVFDAHEIKEPKWKTFLAKLGIIPAHDVIDLSPLEKLSRLQELHISGFNIDNIKPLSSLTNLWFLSLSGLRVRNLEPFASLINLKVLLLEGREIDNLKPLRPLKNLKTLSLSGYYVRKVKHINELTNLRSLNLTYTKVNDLRQVSGLTNLQFLSLHGTRVYDLRPISDMIYLQELDLTSTEVADIGPLKGFTNLQKLSLLRCEKIPDKHVEDLQEALPELKILR